MDFMLPDQLNLADAFLDARVREGAGDKTAIVCGSRSLTYRDVQRLANRFGHALRGLGVEPEQRVLLALPDGPEYVGALFGVLKIGAVVVMVNPQLRPEEIAYLYDYTRAKVVVTTSESLETFGTAARDARHRPRILVVGGGGGEHASFDPEGRDLPDVLEAEPTHRDDVAI